MLKKICCFPQCIINKLQIFDFLGPLALRLYLVPIFWMAGMQKFQHIESTIRWFGNTAWGLGLPYPHILAWLATIVEILGAVLLLLGFGVRWIAMPLIVVMIIAITHVHIANGWAAIAHDTSAATQNLHQFLTWLKTTYPDKHNLLTEHGRPVILNNGVEFAMTYLIMLLSLFFTGAGKYFSVDYWLNRKCGHCNSSC